MFTYPVVYVLANNLLTNRWYSAKLGMNIMPLESTVPWYFIISYRQKCQHSGRANLKGWSSTQSRNFK